MNKYHLNRIIVGLVLIVVALVWLHEAKADESYFYARVGVGKNMMLFSSDSWDDNGEIGCGFGGGYRHNISGNWYGDLSYTHHSQCLSGPPVNNDSESSSDHIFYFAEYRWY